MKMAKAMTNVKNALKVPSKIGFNQGTLALAAFVFVVTIGSSYALNRYDNRFTRDVNSLRAGQNPNGI